MASVQSLLRPFFPPPSLLYPSRAILLPPRSYSLLSNVTDVRPMAESPHCPASPSMRVWLFVQYGAPCCAVDVSVQMDVLVTKKVWNLLSTAAVLSPAGQTCLLLLLLLLLLLPAAAGSAGAGAGRESEYGILPGPFAAAAAPGASSLALHAGAGARAYRGGGGLLAAVPTVVCTQDARRLPDRPRHGDSPAMMACASTFVSTRLSKLMNCTTSLRHSSVRATSTPHNSASPLFKPSSIFTSLWDCFTTK
jgi:hypothetical protein